MAHQPAYLFIISRERLRGRDFLGALEAWLGPDEDLEVIVERRSGESSGKWPGPEDRRKQPHVDIALRKNGFVVVPVSSPRQVPAPSPTEVPESSPTEVPVSSPRDVRAPSPREEWSTRDERAPREMLPLRRDQYPLSLLVPKPASRLDPAPEDYAAADTADDDDDSERLEAIRNFKRARSRRRNVPWLVAVLAGLVVAAFILSRTGPALVDRASQSVSSPSAQTPARTPGPSPAPRNRAVTDKTGASSASEKSNAARPPDGEKPGAAEKSAALEDQAAAETLSRAPAGKSAQIERSTRANLPARSSTEPARASARESAPRPAVSAPAPAERAARLVSPRFAGLPRVELSREPGSAGGAYAVRILDPADKPISDAEVLLMARMSDGTVENVRLDFYPDHGTYRGALPPTASSPTDLRVRVITGDRRVEIPFSNVR